MKKMSVYLPKPDELVASMFSRRDWFVSPTPDDADLIQFVGGADVNPLLYGQGVHNKTQMSMGRDVVDSVAYRYAREFNKPTAGICRGAQFLWTMNGGQLFQDVNNHQVQHPLISYASHDKICMASSVHHQMMMDTDQTLRHSIPIAYASEATRKEWCDMKKGLEYKQYDNPVDDMEVAFFTNTNTLCFQPHPEYEGFDLCEDLYFNLIWQYLIVKS